MRAGDLYPVYVDRHLAWEMPFQEPIAVASNCQNRGNFCKPAKYSDDTAITCMDNSIGLLAVKFIT